MAKLSALRMLTTLRRRRRLSSLTKLRVRHRRQIGSPPMAAQPNYSNSNSRSAKCFFHWPQSSTRLSLCTSWVSCIFRDSSSSWPSCSRLRDFSVSPTDSFSAFSLSEVFSCLCHPRLRAKLSKRRDDGSGPKQHGHFRNVVDSGQLLASLRISSRTWRIVVSSFPCFPFRFSEIVELYITLHLTILRFTLFSNYGTGLFGPLFSQDVGVCPNLTLAETEHIHDSIWFFLFSRVDWTESASTSSARGGEVHTALRSHVEKLRSHLQLAVELSKSERERISLSSSSNLQLQSLKSQAVAHTTAMEQ
jgi:hypothetical protein